MKNIPGFCFTKKTFSNRKKVVTVVFLSNTNLIVRQVEEDIEALNTLTIHDEDERERAEAEDDMAEEDNLDMDNPLFRAPSEERAAAE